MASKGGEIPNLDVGKGLSEKQKKYMRFIEEQVSSVILSDYASP